MNTKRKILAAALIGVAGLLAPMVQAGGDHGRGDSGGAFKLEGAWVAKVPLGEPPAPQLQWSYVLSPDASGRRASLHDSIDVGLGIQSLITEPIMGSSPLIGELVMTGPHSGRFNSVWYVLGADTSGYGLTAKILAIGVNKGEWKSIGPGKTQGWHHIAFYDPSTDADGDGFPDPGQSPITELPESTSFDTRIGAP